MFELRCPSPSPPRPQEVNTTSDKSDRDNHADQLNPNNDAYWESRGDDERPDDWEERAEEEQDGDDE